MDKVIKKFIGIVVSNKMQKTVVVEVRSRVRDRVFGKYVTHREKFHAHDEKGECRQGDQVSIAECRPLSRLKRWRVERVVAKSVGGNDLITEEVPS
ncbi:MAG: 30S ribosomal protein S17 [Deltaproteobacteria bacterium]|nr:30S ribosomal protein S17 [Deltaproteobacteria bacterium]